MAQNKAVNELLQHWIFVWQEIHNRIKNKDNAN